MKNKKIVFVIAFLIFVSGSPVLSNAAVNSGEFAKLRDSITKRILKMEVEEARILGDQSALGGLKNWSPKAIKAEVKFCLEALRRLARVQISSPNEKLDKEVLTAHLKYLEYYYGKFHGELGNLQISAYPYDVIQYELQRFATAEKPDAESAKKHYNAVEGILRGIPNYLQQQQLNLQAGLVLRKADRQILANLIDRIGSPSNQDSIRGGLKGLSENLESEKIRTLISSNQRKRILKLISPADNAYALHTAFLKREIEPSAGENWALGKKDYVDRFKLIYGDRVSVEELVQDAEKELTRLNKEMVALAGELKPGQSLEKVLEELRTQHFDSEQKLLEAYERIQKRIDENITSKIGLEVGAAKYQSAPSGVSVTPATNWPAPLLSPGLGIVLVDTSKLGLSDNYVIELPYLTIHEGGPGHASQSVFFQRAFREGKAPLCRFLNIPDEVGYVRGNWYAMTNIEGWAFYTERLLLKSNLLTREERLGSLSGQALRAARVVVDIRMHTEGWSRDNVAEYLEKKAAMSRKDAVSEAYRYSWIPLQAVAYFFGARQFEKLHEKYEQKFGDKFYQQILSLGPVPPSLIDDYLKSAK